MNKTSQIIVAVALVACALPVFCADVAVLDNGFSIRHERREVIGETTRLYLSASEHSGYIDVLTARIASIETEEAPAAPPADANAAAPAPQQLGEQPGTVLQAAPAPEQPGTVNDFIKAASEKHYIDRALIESVINAESSYNPRAVSPKGAQGLMQLMPTTAAKLGVNNAFDPRSNVDGGTRYLQELLIKYNNNLAKALAAYNAGPHRVQQYNGIPPYRETHNYVARIIAEFNRKKLAEAGTPAPAAKKQTRTKKTAAKSAAGSGSSGQR